MEELFNNDIDAPDERDIKEDKIHVKYMEDVVNATRRTIEDAVYEALDTGLDLRFINQCVKDSFTEYAENHPNDSSMKTMQNFFEEPELKSNDTIEENFISQPIKNDQSVKDFIDHLNDPNFEVQKQDYMALIEYVGVVEKQYDSILKELNALKEQVGGIKDKENPLVSIVAKVQEEATDIGEKLNALKDRIITFTQNALETVKEKGLITLDKVSGFLEIKDNLQAMSKGLEKAIDHAEKSIQKIDSISREYHEMENRAANIGRIFAGKETSSDIKENGKLAKALQLPQVGLQKALTAMSDTVKKAIEKVQSLEAYASERQPHITKENEIATSSAIAEESAVSFNDAKLNHPQAENVTLAEKDLPPSGGPSDLKAAQGNVFVLTDQGYNYRAANRITDIKTGQCVPDYKNQVPRSWLEKGWVKEVSQDTLPEIYEEQAAKPSMANSRQPVMDLEPQ